uniref:Uncharacterized protein n=1 Tax=Globodera rostochiensis TaxID=31243 RepID=A0A914GWG0_GLORO
MPAVDSAGIQQLDQFEREGGGLNIHSHDLMPNEIKATEENRWRRCEANNGNIHPPVRPWHNGIILIRPWHPSMTSSSSVHGIHQ